MRRKRQWQCCYFESGDRSIKQISVSEPGCLLCSCVSLWLQHRAGASFASAKFCSVAARGVTRNIYNFNYNQFDCPRMMLASLLPCQPLRTFPSRVQDRSIMSGLVDWTTASFVDGHSHSLMLVSEENTRSTHHLGHFRSLKTAIATILKFCLVDLGKF